MENSFNIELLNRPEKIEECQQEFIPRSFEDYLGQEELKQKLSVYATAAIQRKEPLDHLLLFGPPGLGKTTLAQLIAHQMDVAIKIISGPMLDRTGDLVAILSGLGSRDVLFIDEIHRMPTNVEEVLYSAMEQFSIDVIIGQGAGAKTINLPLNPFTLIGATTKSGAISAPLRSRFGIVERLDFYDEQSLCQIVMQSTIFLGLSINQSAAFHIAQCARGTPRIAKKIVRRIRDFAQIKHSNHIDELVVQEGLSFLGIDTDGLSTIDNLLLKKIIEHFNGGPVGLETLASIIGEDKETIELVIEPFLLRKGLLEKTPRGRQIPGKALLYLKNKYTGQKGILS